MQRFRIHYAKTTPLRYTGSLDMQKVWERYLRRAALQMAYSQGFHPQAKIQQACPLPLGFLSLAEIVDVWLDDDQIDERQLLSSLVSTPQPGIEIQSAAAVPLNSPALQSLVASAEYSVELLTPVEYGRLGEQIQRLLTAPSLPRIRRQKTYDLRPLIEAVEFTENESPGLAMRLSAREGATGRPDEVLIELGLNPARTRITRTALIFQPIR